VHHSLRFYSRYREKFLRYYIFQAKWTRIPVVGSWVRWVANQYGNKGSSAYLLTEAEAAEIIDVSGGVALGPCTCRKTFHNCDNLLEAEIMIGLHQNVFFEEHPQEYRIITREAAKDVLKECHKRGLIHTIIRCREDYYAICNCCTCCCVPLRLSKQYGIGNAVKRHADIVGEFKKQQAQHVD
jgi:hypothetical protein